MKKQLYYCLCIGFIVLGGVGCATEQTDIKATPSPTKASSFFAPAKEKEKKEEVVVLEGLCETLEKKDTSKETSYNSFHRMTSKIKGVETSLFCIDGETGVVYFANKGKDGYLYRMKEGKVELAVSMPVKEIYTYGDSVYFMIEDYGKYELKDMNNGDIYCYTPNTGKVQLIYPAGEIENATEHKLMVNSDGIYFSYSIYEDSSSSRKYSCYLAFGETEPVADMKSMTSIGWGNYYLSFPYISNSPKFALVSRTDYLEDVKEVTAGTLRYCVVGDILYSVDIGSTSLSCFNLKTGEEIEYDFLEVAQKVHVDLEGKITLTDRTEVFQSFLVMEEEIWMSGAGCLYHLDLSSGEMTYYKLISNPFESYAIEALYTDGEQLYAILCSSNETESSFHRILTEEVVLDYKGDIALQVESLTK